MGPHPARFNNSTRTNQIQPNPARSNQIYQNSAKFKKSRCIETCWYNPPCSLCRLYKSIANWWISQFTCGYAVPKLESWTALPVHMLRQVAPKTMILLERGAKNGFRKRSYIGYVFGSDLGPILDRFWDRFWDRFRSHFGTILGPFWDHFGTIFGPF